MTLDEFRTEVQKCLKSERKVTDVAFEPLEGDLERVYFWDSGVRGNFLIAPGKVTDKQTLHLAVKAQAQTAFSDAKVQEAKDAEKRVADAAALNEKGKK